MASIYRAAFASLGFALICSGAHADLTISKKPTQNVDCSAGTCRATAIGANLNTNDLISFLAAGDLAVVAQSQYDQNIEVLDGFSWSSTSRLALATLEEIGIHKPIIVAGKGSLELDYYDQIDPELGLRFINTGRVDFLDLSATYTAFGGSYTLVADLATLASDIAENPNGRYALASDLDARHLTFDTVPVPTDFGGKFDGLGHRISHLSIKGAANNREGLFAHVQSYGVLRDINLSNVNITSGNSANIVGSVVGQNDWKIYNISVSGAVRGVALYMGGVQGSGYQIWSSNSAANVTASNNATAGGLAGSANASNSHATGSVQVGNSGFAGGLVGSGIIWGSSATGSVTGGNGSQVGGVVGYGEALGSFSTGDVTAGNDAAIVGGLVGSGYAEAAYSTGTVSGGSNGDYIGGAVGLPKFEGTYFTYAAGIVSGGDGSYTGGFAGGRIPDGKINYWDITTSRQENGCGQGTLTKCGKRVTGLTDTALKSSLPNGFSPSEWGQSPNINNGYPYLLANPPQ